MSLRFPALAALALAPLAGCGGARHDSKEATVHSPGLLDKYTTVKLTADLSGLTHNERLMLPLLIEAARAMDDVFWLQAYGDKRELLSSIEDPVVRRFAEINYGPWDRLEGNRSQYTLIRRNASGGLDAVGYGEAYSRPMSLAAERLREAAALAEDPQLEDYLELRADALLSDRYRESDVAWLDMRDNTLDIVIGPIETYEDQLFGYKAAAESYVLIKDAEWSRRLARYAARVPRPPREMGDKDVRDNYVTFLASVFRSTRFGAASAHGRANAARFNFFEDMGAFSRDEATGTYRVDFDRMEAAMAALAEKILRFQGDGDYDGVKAFMDRTAQIGPTLAHDLGRLSSAGIPVDIVFDQGVEVLGLESTAD